MASSGLLGSYGSRALDWLLLRAVSRRVERYSTLQAAEMRKYVAASSRLIRPARALRVQGRGAASLLLYREGTCLLISGVLAAHDDPSRNLDSDHGDGVARLSALVESGKLSAPPVPLDRLQGALGISPLESGDGSSEDD